MNYIAESGFGAFTDFIDGVMSDVQFPLSSFILKYWKLFNEPDLAPKKVEVLRAAETLRPYGFHVDLNAVHKRLFSGHLPMGIRIGSGFGAQTGVVRSDLPDPRDLLSVVGWVDEAFRCLAIPPNLLVAKYCTTR